ncbi:alpha-2,8-sialyltransferase 8F-like [Synchiropus picturatus]
MWGYKATVTILCLGSLATTMMWFMEDDSHLEAHRAPQIKRQRPKPSQLCKGCKKIIDSVVTRYSKTWRKQEMNYQKFKVKLQQTCNGFDNAIVTQANTPLGSTILFETSAKKLLVNSELFNLFPNKHPFSNKTLDTCAVVGNGGILYDSNCGKLIDSAEFVIRCNLPPLTGEYEKHVGKKTNIVTANPTILLKLHQSLMERRLPFAEKMQLYGSAMILLPAFSYNVNLALSLRAAYTMKDFKSSVSPVFLNPQYLRELGGFWKARGVKAKRITSGLMMVSLALEVCNNVHVYGFWPFANHPFDLYPLPNHYYDDIWPKPGFHAMPTEFEHLLQLHTDGILKLHLGRCNKN